MSSTTMTSIDLLIRVSLLLGAGMVSALLLHRRSASVRHLALSASLGGALVLGVLVPWAPRLDVPVKAWKSDAARGARTGRALRDIRGLPKVVTRETSASVADDVVTNDALSSDSIRLSGVTIVSASGRPPLWLLAWVAGALLTLGWGLAGRLGLALLVRDRKSTRLNSSHGYISYAVFCL